MVNSIWYILYALDKKSVKILCKDEGKNDL